MAKRHSSAAVKPSPLVGIEKPLDVLANAIEALPWVDNAFLLAEPVLKQNPEGRETLVPTVPAVGGQHMELLPDEGLGNYTWFDLVDQRIENQLVIANVGLVLFANLETVYASAVETKSREHVLEDLLKVLTMPWCYVRRFEREPAKVYRIYDPRHHGAHYTMRPFVLARVDFQLRYPVSERRFATC